MIQNLIVIAAYVMYSVMLFHTYVISFLCLIHDPCTGQVPKFTCVELPHQRVGEQEVTWLQQFIQYNFRLA